MDGKVKVTKAEKLLLGITAAFLCLLLALALRARASGALGSYTVETGRSVSSAELVPDMTPVDLNTAAADELAGLPGIGPKLAQRIVDYRAEHGAFASVDALTGVSGIGEKKLEDLRDYVTVGGAEN